MEIKPLIKPGRQCPYVTVVDTALLMAAQNLLAVLSHSTNQGRTVLDLDGDEQMLDPERVGAIANRIADALQDRTF